MAGCEFSEKTNATTGKPLLTSDFDSLHDALGPHPFTKPAPTPDPLRVKFKALKDFSKLTFNLANGLTVTDPEDAAKELLRREYPNITKMDKAIFISGFFVPHDPILVADLDDDHKMVMKREGGVASTNKMIKFLAKSKYDARMDAWRTGGDKGEGIVYHSLQEVFENDVEGSADLIIIHELHLGQISARDHSGKKIELTKEQEHDFFIISSKRKLFGPLEVKTTLTRHNHTKASKQLQMCQQIIQKLFWDVLENDGWQFCSSVFFVDQNKAKICKTKCEKYALFPTSDFGAWWENIKKQFPVIDEKEQTQARAKALRVIKMLLFNVHIKLPTTTSRSIETITEVMGKISTLDNILFWTKDQIHLMSGIGNEYILFKSYYGSGRSIL